jgi:hypothetical protein
MITILSYPQRSISANVSYIPSRLNEMVYAQFFADLISEVWRRIRFIVDSQTKHDLYFLVNSYVSLTAP